MKSKLLPILLILLVLLNGFLIFMLINKPHENRPNHPQRNFLTEQLNFSETQKEEFRMLDKTHREIMMSLDENIRHNKDVLFNSFSSKGINIDSLTSKIGLLESKKEAELFSFFSKVRRICTEKQKINFDKIINEALKGGKRNPPRREGDNHPPRGEIRMPPPR